jgi:magnesium chelatase accessory protein
MSYRLDLERDGHDWPHRGQSRLVKAGGLTWHVQRLGQGPTLLLVHGTGAATHSFAALMDRLRDHFDIIAMDLPGHGFTAPTGSRGMSLDGMAEGIDALLTALEARPALAVGHSAGAAILIRMAARGMIQPASIVSLNGALVPFKGWAGQVFQPMARMFSMLPIMPMIFAWRASNPAFVGEILSQTGSKIDAATAERYSRLARSTGHAQAAFDMMANWDLPSLQPDIETLDVPLVLVGTQRDRMVPADDAYLTARKNPRARAIRLEGVGHLAHEEAPDRVAQLIDGIARECGVLPPQSEVRAS